MQRQDGVDLTNIREINTSYTHKRALCFCISKPQDDLNVCLLVCTVGASTCTACEAGKYVAYRGEFSFSLCAHARSRSLSPTYVTNHLCHSRCIHRAITGEILIPDQLARCSLCMYVRMQCIDTCHLYTLHIITMMTTDGICLSVCSYICHRCAL